MISLITLVWVSTILNCFLVRLNLSNFEPPKAANRPTHIAHVASLYRFKGWDGHFGYIFLQYVFEVSVSRIHIYVH